MNIIFQTLNTSYRSSVPTQPRPKTKAEKAKGDYDTVNIRRTATAQDDEESFARILARRTVSQLGSVSQERVQELGRRVADGTYTPDAKRIAGRLLGLG